MLDKIKKEPALVSAAVTLLGAVLGVFIKNPALVASMITVAGFFLGVRQVVTPVTTMTENVAKAATDAATEVTKQLSDTTVGVAGNVTKAGSEIINNVVNQTVGNLLGGKVNA